MEKKRLYFIDEYRGFWLINMILYHAIWDIVYIFGCDWRWYKSDMAFFWQQSICWSFIFISGFCWQMGRNKFKNGIKVFGEGIVITLATLIFMPDSRVIFGVLTLLGSSMLLMIPCDVVFKKINPWLGALLSFILFLFTYPVNDGYLGFGGVEMVQLPRELYSSWLSTYLGFPEPGFWSTDYFSLLPWFFLYAVGYFAYKIVFMREEKTQIKEIMEKSICSPLGWIGRNSLVIYMLHQPVIYGVLYLWFMFFNI